MIGNALVAAAKTAAAVFTRSLSLFTEAVHSRVDTGNEVFVLVAERLANLQCGHSARPCFPATTGCDAGRRRTGCLRRDRTTPDGRCRVAPEALTADTPRTTVEGATFIAPDGWSITVRGPATILEAPRARLAARAGRRPRRPTSTPRSTRTGPPTGHRPRGTSPALISPASIQTSASNYVVGLRMLH